MKTGLSGNDNRQVHRMEILPGVFISGANVRPTACAHIQNPVETKSCSCGVEILKFGCGVFGTCVTQLVTKERFREHGPTRGLAVCETCESFEAGTS